MIKTLISQVGEYKKVSLLTPLFTALEVLMEILIPFITASIIDKGIEAGDMRQVCFYGAIMLIISQNSSPRQCVHSYPCLISQLCKLFSCLFLPGLL